MKGSRVLYCVRFCSSRRPFSSLSISSSISNLLLPLVFNRQEPTSNFLCLREENRASDVGPPTACTQILKVVFLFWLKNGHIIGNYPKIVGHIGAFATGLDIPPNHTGMCFTHSGHGSIVYEPKNPRFLVSLLDSRCVGVFLHSI